MKTKTTQECIIELRSLRMLKSTLQRYIDSHEAALKELKANLGDCEDRLLGVETNIENIIRRGRLNVSRH